MTIAHYLEYVCRAIRSPATGTRHRYSLVGDHPIRAVPRLWFHRIANCVIPCADRKRHIQGNLPVLCKYGILPPWRHCHLLVAEYGLKRNGTDCRTPWAVSQSRIARKRHYLDVIGCARKQLQPGIRGVKVAAGNSVVSSFGSAL